MSSRSSACFRHFFSNTFACACVPFPPVAARRLLFDKNLIPSKAPQLRETFWREDGSKGVNTVLKGGAFEDAQHGVSDRRGATDKAEWGPAGLCLGAF